MMQKKFPSSKRNDRMWNDVIRKIDKMAHQVVIVRFYFLFYLNISGKERRPLLCR